MRSDQTCSWSQGFPGLLSPLLLLQLLPALGWARTTSGDTAQHLGTRHNIWGNGTTSGWVLALQCPWEGEGEVAPLSAGTALHSSQGTQGTGKASELLTDLQLRSGIIPEQTCSEEWEHLCELPPLLQELIAPCMAPCSTQLWELQNPSSLMEMPWPSPALPCAHTGWVGRGQVPAEELCRAGTSPQFHNYRWSLPVSLGEEHPCSPSNRESWLFPLSPGGWAEQQVQ